MEYMKHTVLVILSIFITMLALANNQTKQPLFNDNEIDVFVEQVQKTKRIPDHAIGIVFDFYKKNRASTGGLKDTSCIDKKEFKIRNKDPKVTKTYLKNGIENESCICVIDYTVTKNEKRGHCIFLAKNSEPKIESFYASHGSGSKEEKGCPTTFTNKLTSTGTTLSGLFLTSLDTYAFQGKMRGLGPYTSTGLSLYGVESTNWTAGNVGKATHGAPYVRGGDKKNIGRSLGCPAMEVDQAKSMLPRCTGKAAWLNYTFEVKNRLDITPQACK